MGDPGMAASSSRHAVYEAFKTQCSAQWAYGQLAVVELIRSVHRDKTIICVNPANCDLVGFARAGHAKSQLISADDNYLATRSYVGTTSRLDEGDGTVRDSVTFGHYTFRWNDRDFPFYSVGWLERAGNFASYYYILADRDDDTAVDDLIKVVGKWSTRLHEEIYVFDNGNWQKNHRLWTSVQNASWDDVILNEAMKETLISDVTTFFDSRAIYEEYGVPWKRGIILHGTPGCGKTISVKALMNSLQSKDVASLYVKSINTAQGSMQRSVRSIFTQARAMAPCLLIFEDLDSLVGSEVRSYFLNEVDGLEDNNGLLMLGSTNHLDRLDPGIAKRPSRFDRKYHYALPGRRERFLYCQYWQHKLAKNSNVDFQDRICDIVAELTEGFSFAYLKELFVQALLAIVGGRADVTDDDLIVPDATLAKVAEETKVIPGSAKLATEGESTSSSDTNPAPSSTTAAEDPQPADAKPTPHIPSVAIPVDLESNALLRILRKQTIALVQNMGSADDGVTERSKVPSADQSARGPVRIVRRAK
nr:putative atpase yjob [Quercus suber]